MKKTTSFYAILFYILFFAFFAAKANGESGAFDHMFQSDHSYKELKEWFLDLKKSNFPKEWKNDVRRDGYEHLMSYNAAYISLKTLLNLALSKVSTEYDTKEAEPYDFIINAIIFIKMIKADLDILSDDQIRFNSEFFSVVQ